MDAVTGRTPPFIAAVCGVKNSGKTTFLEKLIPCLKRRGYRVALIKHDGHEFQGDVPGTDTWRLKQAGAYGTAIFSGSRWMAVKEQADISPEKLFPLFPEADIILLEGMKHSAYPKFELVRSAVSDVPVCDPRTIMALVTDLPEESLKRCAKRYRGIPVCLPEEIERCADILEKRMKE